MRMIAPGWDRLEMLLAVIDTGSLSAASRQLGVSQPTARRQIELLESELGTALFTRTSAGLQPTEAALNARAHADDMARAAAALVRTVSGAATGASGTVRIACSEVFGVEILPPMIADLAARHPGLHIELHLNNRDEDILRREADIAVRMHRPTQIGLVARKVGIVELGLYASPAYVARHPLPATPDELTGHSLIGQDRLTSIGDTLALAFEGSALPVFTIRTDSDLAQLAMIDAGAGLGVCQTAIARRRGFVRALPTLRLELETWLTMHEDLGRIYRYRLVFDGLAGLLGNDAANPAS